MDIDNLILENVEPKRDLKSLFDECSVDLAVEIERPEILLSIGQHSYKGQFYDTPIMTAGEFSAITAQSKAKKSFLKSALLGSYIGGNSNLMFPNIKTHRSNEDYTVLDVDTEQGKYYAQRTFRRVLDIVGSTYDNYHCLCTRQLKSMERIELIDGLLKNQSTYFKNPVKLVSIDGIADLIENTNDIVMSKEVADYLLRWTHDYNIHITTVIHKSGVTNKPLGHLGTYVLKKAETVIDLEVCEETKEIIVRNTYSRGYSFNEFRFDVNDDALPYLIE